MSLVLLAYLAGVLTILSPCILPVLPFLFARAGQPFARSLLPMLGGLVLTFAAVASLAALGGGWVVAANQYGRVAALLLLAFFGLTLLSPALAEWAMRPFVALGNRLADRGRGDGPVSALILGVATGLLWAPCAGPVLGLILTGAALGGASLRTSLLLLAYGAGSASSLALALLAGGRVLARLRRNLGAAAGLRRGLGLAVLAGVAVIAFGLDNGLLTRLSLASTNSLEQSLIDRIKPAPVKTAGAGTVPAMMPAGTADSPPVEGPAPELAGATTWLNSPPLTLETLRGKVVLVDFWTYSCINCLRTLPTIRAWADKYKDYGLVVIGVHAPEFAFEKDLGNVTRAVGQLGIVYPVAVDNGYALWRAFANEYWPAHYFIDGRGRIRHHHFGEGGAVESEAVIRRLLEEAGQRNLPPPTAMAAAPATDGGVMAAADFAQVASPETYLGTARAENFRSPGGAAENHPKTYAPPPQLRLNDWGLTGRWTVSAESAGLDTAPGQIVFRFRARDLHLVLGPTAEGRPLRFRVRLDGASPGADHGVDVSPEGDGTVSGHRLYQLVRQAGPVRERTFSIEFFDPGVQAYSFTFG